MATQRNDGHLGQRSGSDKRGTQSQRGRQDGLADEELELHGTTDDGVEVSASMDDDNGGASDELDARDEAEQDGSRGARGKPGGTGNFANDPDRAREAGRKGGSH